MGIMTVEDVARELKISEDMVIALIVSGKLKSFKVEDSYRISESALNMFIECSEKNNLSTNTSTSVDKPDEGTVTLQEKSCNWRKKKVKVYFTEPKKGNGLIAQIDLGNDSESGKRLRKSHRVKTREEGFKWAEAFLAEHALLPETEKEKADMYNAGIHLPKNPKLKDYMEAFLYEGFGSGTSVTTKGYYDAAKPIVKELGDFKLKELTYPIVKKMFKKFSTMYAQKSIDKQFLVLNKAVKKAIHDGYLSEDILSGFFDEYGKHSHDYPCSQKDTEDVIGYTDEELKIIFNAAVDYCEIYPMLMLLNDTGIRPGEMRGLQWSKIDFENNTITVDSTIVSEYKNLSLVSNEGMEAKEVYKKGVKTTRNKRRRKDAGIRTVPFSSETAQALHAWREYVLSNEDFEYVKDSEFVFVSRTGKVISRSALRSKMVRFLNSSKVGEKVQGFTLYRFRHTFCTRLALSGAPMPVTMLMMGDKTSDLVMNVYTNISKNDSINIVKQKLGM